MNEIDQLRRANPITPRALEQAVSMDRAALIESLEADSGGGRSRLRMLGHRSLSSPTRVGYVGALAAAAAILIGVVLIGGENSPTDRGVVESADEIPPPTDPEAVPGQDEPASDSDPTSETTPNPNLPEGAAPEPDQGPTSTDQPLPTSTQPEPEQASTTADSPASAPTSTPPRPAIEGPFDPSVDLLVLHYDHAHLDDGHATVAAFEIATNLGMQPHVVAGTLPSGYDGYVNDYEPVMQATWGDAWLNAHLDRSGATSRSVERWLSTLDAGGRVWVADGGASDFTAEVVREIQRQRPGLDTNAAVHVVQHNDRNESESAPENLAFLNAETAYERIDDGNSANGTADLNQRSDTLVATALAGRNNTRWSAAFDYFPADELDFSDTVEVLHILGIGTDEISSPDDFANRFME